MGGLDGFCYQTSFGGLCLAQVHPQVWRLVLCLHHLAEKAGICLTFPYLVHPYFCNIYQQGVINLSQWGSKALIFKCGDDFDCQWFERQLVIWTKFLYTNDKIQFLEKQNLNPIPKPVQRVLNIEEWVSKKSITSELGGFRALYQGNHEFNYFLMESLYYPFFLLLT